MEIQQEQVVKCEEEPLGNVVDIHIVKIEEHLLEIEIKEEFNESDPELNYSVNSNKISSSITENSRNCYNFQLSKISENAC